MANYMQIFSALGGGRNLRRVPSKSDRIWSFSLLRIGLLVYLITYGFFGYGSEASIDQPLSLLPPALGALLMLLGTLWKSIPDARIRISVDEVSSMAYQFLLFSLLGTIVFLLFGERELNLDELSFTRLATTHTREIILRSVDIGGDEEVAQITQVLSIVIVAGLAVLSYVAIWRPSEPRSAFFFVGAIVLVFQIFYSLFGGWGWGYTETPWIALLLAGSVGGFLSLTLKLVPVLMLTLGVTIFNTLQRRNGVGRVTRLLSAFTLLFSPSILSGIGEVDHVVFGFLGGAIVIPVLMANPSIVTLQKIVFVLSLGLLFRITLVGLLIFAIAYLFVKWRAERPRGTWIKLVPALMFTAPYLSGFALFPPVVTEIGELAPLTEFDLTVATSSVLLASSQAGYSALILLAAAILISWRRPPWIALGAFLLLYSFYFYFYSLLQTGISTQPKYATEWLAWILFFSLSAVTNSTNSGRNFGLFARVASSLTLLLLLVASSYQNFFQNLPRTHASNFVLDAAELRPKSWGIRYVHDHLSLSSIENCVPVGPLFGGTNELLHGRSVAAFRFSEVWHYRMQAKQTLGGGDWMSLDPSLAESGEVRCLYGLESSFTGFAAGEWLDWEIHFAHGSDPDRLIILTRQ